VTRRLRQLFCRLLLCTLLFSQWAVASYVCPGMPSAQASAATGMAAMADCDDVAGMPDPASPKLCVDHCQQGQQSVDRADPPVLAAALLATFYPLPLAIAGRHQEAAPAARRGEPVAASPPHEILHCCFRI